MEVSHLVTVPTCKAAPESNRRFSPFFSHLNIIRQKPMVIPKIHGHITESGVGKRRRKTKRKGGREEARGKGRKNGREGRRVEKELNIYIHQTVA